MADAGYANGFEITLNCPNDRYINDEAIVRRPWVDGQTGSRYFDAAEACISL